VAYLGKGIVLNKFTGSRGKSGSNDANAEYIGRIRKMFDDEDVAYKILCYTHYSLQGDLEGKRGILEKLAHKLEPNENELQQINPCLKKHLFGAFNNLNIRHNNIEAMDGYFNKNFAQLQDTEKEELYDSIYRDCLIAFLELENSSVRQKVKQIIAKK
ncbi:MAG: hypothetical protein MJ197_01540, partial [Bacteroidales bacterium]|nr:hypothetical protein [Bacteroidales bacterium]